MHKAYRLHRLSFFPSHFLHTPFSQWLAYSLLLIEGVHSALALDFLCFSIDVGVFWIPAKSLFFFQIGGHYMTENIVWDREDWMRNRKLYKKGGPAASKGKLKRMEFQTHCKEPEYKQAIATIHQCLSCQPAANQTKNWPRGWARDAALKIPVMHCIPHTWRYHLFL